MWFMLRCWFWCGSSAQTRLEWVGFVFDVSFGSIPNYIEHISLRVTQPFWIMGFVCSLILNSSVRGKFVDSAAQFHPDAAAVDQKNTRMPYTRSFFCSSWRQTAEGQYKCRSFSESQLWNKGSGINCGLLILVSIVSVLQERMRLTPVWTDEWPWHTLTEISDGKRVQ